jgi:RimJ/RimL family protein N-acetyltransferase
VIPDDGGQLTRQARAAIEAFMASRPGDPSRVTLRLITAADQDEILGLAATSAGLHHPWMTLAATPQEFQDYLRRFDHVTAEGFLICTRATGAIAGVAHINSIIRGRFQNGSLSYAAFAPAAGQGYMPEGLGLVLRYAFEQLRCIAWTPRSSLATTPPCGSSGGSASATRAIHPSCCSSMAPGETTNGGPSPATWSALSPRTRIRACPDAEAGTHAPVSARTSSTVRFASATNPGFVSG